VLALAVAGCGAESATPAAAPPSTAPVERGALSATVAVNGTLTYRGRPDGSPYPVVNYARGIYTRLPAEGDRVGCGDVLYRVDGDPVRLRCGPVPPYRSLAQGKAVYLPEAGRVARVRGTLGGPARPGAEVLQATSRAVEVQVQLDASQPGEVARGDRARITLPDQTTVSGTVARLGRVARTPDPEEGGGATLPAFITLDDPGTVRGLDRAAVRVEITTTGVQDVLSVPVLALVGRAGGGFAVEVAHRGLVAVELGLFDTARGRVEVTGDLRAGDDVVVPSP
jgi:multidrug efflux pump subunit AcrA (membrane-fusion protein)